MCCWNGGVLPAVCGTNAAYEGLYQNKFVRASHVLALHWSLAIQPYPSQHCGSLDPIHLPCASSCTRTTRTRKDHSAVGDLRNKTHRKGKQ